MGTLFVGCEIASIGDRSKKFPVRRMLVDMGSEFTWAPRGELDNVGIDREKMDLTFVMANGQQVTRSVGFAIVRVEGKFTFDEVVFAEEGDLLVLGARSLKGLNLAVDPAHKKLVAVGPLPAASIYVTRSESGPSLTS